PARLQAAPGVRCRSVRCVSELRSSLLCHSAAGLAFSPSRLGVRSCRLALDAVRIGDVEAPQNRALELFHGLGIAVALMIVTAQMQKSVHRKMGNMMSKRFAVPLRLARHRIVSKHDVAEQRR